MAKKNTEQVIQELLRRIEALEQENKILKQKAEKGSIPEEVIKKALATFEEKFNTKITKHMIKDTTIVFKTADGIYSTASINTSQKRLYIRQKLSKDDIELLYQLSRQD